MAIITLKRRGFFVREVPVPPDLMDDLDLHFDIRAAQADPERRGQRLWPWSRTTAWRRIKDVMRRAEVSGRQACPRGLRHSFGLGTLHAKVPINLTQAWLGHARLSTTAIYAAACGPEELAFADLFWRPPHVTLPQAYQVLRERHRTTPCLQDNHHDADRLTLL